MKPAPTRYRTAQGEFDLRRYPDRPKESLQAWCAADILLVTAALEHELSGSPLLVGNDDFGALALPLQAQASWTDSWLAAEALRLNTQANTVPAPIPSLWSTEPPAADIRAVVMRVPKQLPYFRYQLAHLAAQLEPGALVIAGGMDKHLSRHTAEAMEQWIGPTTRHRGNQKARLFSAHLGVNAPGDEKTSATNFNSSYYCEDLGAELVALPNVFSGGSLDIGTRFLLAQLKQLEPADKVIDLACGNGVIGLCALQEGIARQVLFADESAMAIESARRNYKALQGDSEPFDSHHGDGLHGYAGAPVDLILCNPPFHLGHTVDEFAGRRLISQCSRHLRPDGKLCLVANRHLNYLPVLRRHFTHVDTIGANNKFKLYLAHSPTENSAKT